MIIKRGCIYLAALDPTIGSEIAKTRPVLIVSNDINNQYSGTITILPITSKNLKKIYPYIPQHLNRILLHFSEGAHCFYETTDQLLEDLEGYCAAFG